MEPASLGCELLEPRRLMALGGDGLSALVESSWSPERDFSSEISAWIQAESHLRQPNEPPAAGASVSASVELADGTLTIRGTDAVDIFAISVDESDIAIQYSNLAAEAIWNFDTQAISGISVLMGDGDDELSFTDHDGHLAGTVTVRGQNGNDFVTGGAYESDGFVFKGGRGDDFFWIPPRDIRGHFEGGKGNDSAMASGNGGIFEGGDGRDEFWAVPLAFQSRMPEHVMKGGDDDDSLMAFGGDNLLKLGRGNDVAVVWSGIVEAYQPGGTSVINGGKGSDTIYTAQSSQVKGGDDDDFIFLGGGAGLETEGHLVDAGEGHDYVKALADAFIDGNDGNDFIIQAGGDGAIEGGSGHDQIHVWQGDNSVEGNGGDDTIHAGAGNGRYDGGPGYDRLRLRGASMPDNFLVDRGIVQQAGGYAVPDVNEPTPPSHLPIEHMDSAYSGDAIRAIRLAARAETAEFLAALAFAQTVNPELPVDHASHYEAFEALEVDLRQADDTLEVVQVLDVALVVHGGAGDDLVRSPGGNTVVTGDAGNDAVVAVGNDSPEHFTVVGGLVTRTLACGVGEDLQVRLETVESLEIDARGGDDRVNASAMSADLTLLVKAGAGDDHVVGSPGPDVIDAGRGRDVVFGNAGDDVLRGGDQNDRLYGGSGVDRLLGEGGDDFLDGGRDGLRDRLRGGSGRDTFVQYIIDHVFFNWNEETIEDYQYFYDTISGVRVPWTYYPGTVPVTGGVFA